jgi:hypothetical protein
MHTMTEQLIAAADVVVNPTVINTEEKPVAPETVTITQESLTAMIQAATQAAVEGLMAQAQASAVVADSVAVPVTGPRQATRPEACSAHKLLSVLDQGLSKVILGIRDHVVPMNIWAVDEAAPQVLAVVAAGSIIAATGARKVSDYFAGLAERAAAGAAALTRR